MQYPQYDQINGEQPEILNQGSDNQSLRNLII